MRPVRCRPQNTPFDHRLGGACSWRKLTFKLSDHIRPGVRVKSSRALRADKRPRSVHAAVTAFAKSRLHGKIRASHSASPQWTPPPPPVLQLHPHSHPHHHRRAPGIVSPAGALGHPRLCRRGPDDPGRPPEQRQILARPRLGDRGGERRRGDGIRRLRAGRRALHRPGEWREAYPLTPRYVLLPWKAAAPATPAMAERSAAGQQHRRDPRRLAPRRRGTAPRGDRCVAVGRPARR